MSITAIIPTLGERPELQPLIAVLVKDRVDVTVLARPETKNIHVIWNRGVKMAREQGADYIAILNDDLVLPRQTLTLMQRLMKEHDYACIGVDPRADFGLPSGTPTVKEVVGDVGILMTEVTTWCFMVKADQWQEIDEGYEWWWGVGDLFTKIVAEGGRLGQATGLGITHIGSGTAKQHPWTQAAIRRDQLRWRRNH